MPSSLRSRIGTAWIALPLVCFALMLGCGEQAPSVSPPREKEDTDPLSALAQPWVADGEVPWGVAETMAQLSKTAYLDEAEAGREFRELGFETVVANVAGPMTAYIVARGPLVVVVFRGTDDLEDWLANLKVVGRDVVGGSMHTGFYDAYQTLRAKVHAASSDTDPKYVWITGHSLGGALAVVCAHDLIQASVSVHGLVTFGQPMTANANLAGYLDKHLTNKYTRFINGADIVARVPPLYSHAGAFVWFRRDGVTRSHGRGANRTDKVQAAKTPPIGPPPLTQTEFQKLQRRLGDLKSKQADPPSASAKISFPPLDDHGMDRYLERVKHRGVVNSSGTKEPTPPKFLERPGPVPFKTPR